MRVLRDAPASRRSTVAILAGGRASVSGIASGECVSELLAAQVILAGGVPSLPGRRLRAVNFHKYKPLISFGFLCRILSILMIYRIISASRR